MSVTASPRDLAVNATLGFEKILALSQGTSWRLRGLRAAAELTGLEIEVPPQPPVSRELAEAFVGMGGRRDGVEKEEVHPQLGAAKAWLAHLNLLEYVVQRGLRTALVMEDDADWDTRIMRQLPLVSDGVRRYTNAPADDPDPYGANWDVLWLGHCGEITNWDIDYTAWPDETVIAHERYRGFAHDWIKKLPEGLRSTNPTAMTVCSFAYGVTREGAGRLLRALDHAGDEAFDVALAHACRRGEQGLRCYTVHPEIFHHYVPPERDGFSSEVRSGNGESALADATALELHMGSTANIEHSTRCYALWKSQCIGET